MLALACLNWFISGPLNAERSSNMNHDRPDYKKLQENTPLCKGKQTQLVKKEVSKQTSRIGSRDASKDVFFLRE